MDPLLIAVISLGSLLLITSLLWWQARRGRRRARRAATESQSDLKQARSSIDSLRIGEREAAWSATATAQRLDRNMIELRKATHDVGRLEADLDELRAHLGTADRELAQLRATADDAVTEISTLEDDLERSRRSATETAGKIRGLEDLERRLTAALKDRDQLSEDAGKSAQLEAELAALASVSQELADTQAENAALRSGVASADRPDDARATRLESELVELRALLAQQADTGDAPLIAAEAARRDLEEQLNAVSTARKAEERAARDRISRLERLHVEIAERDRRIEALEGQSSDGSSAAVGSATYAEWDRTMRLRVDASVKDATDRLQEQVQHLRAVITEKERLLRRIVEDPTVAVPGPMPVTAIKGIGPVIAAILAGHGITSVEDVAALSADSITRLGKEMPVYPDRIHADDWIGQAQTLLGHM